MARPTRQRSKIKVPRGLYLSWRERADGSIVFRWGMAPGLRAQGVKAFDLVDGAGRPLGKAAAIARAAELVEQLKTGAAPRPQPARPGRTVGELLDAYLAPANLDRITTRAQRNRPARPLSAASKRSYLSWRKALDDVFHDQPVAHMDAALVTEWYAAAMTARGHHMAAGALALLKIVWGWADRDWRCADIDWKKVDAAKPPAKLRIGTDDELATLLLAMDDPDALYRRLEEEQGVRVPEAERIPARPQLGDSFVIALWTTQRVKDVLAFSEDAFAGGRLRWITSKNARPLDMPLLGPLPARIEAARRRRRAAGATVPNIVLNPRRPAAYDQNQHGRDFRDARALAARFHPSLVGVGVDQWGRPHKPFTFEDCRDTAITRLYDAGVPIEDLISWSNHATPASLMSLISSYIEISGRAADRAGEKLTAWWKTSGAKV